jgi:hypothetical protein
MHQYGWQPPKASRCNSSAATSKQPGCTHAHRNAQRGWPSHSMLYGWQPPQASRCNSSADLAKRSSQGAHMHIKMPKRGWPSVTHTRYCHPGQLGSTMPNASAQHRKTTYVTKQGSPPAFDGSLVTRLKALAYTQHSPQAAASTCTQTHDLPRPEATQKQSSSRSPRPPTPVASSSTA